MSVDESGRRSYLPGEWFGVFGEHASVLLPPSEKRRVGALWELLDGGADFDEVLDALIATGLRDLPGFLLVSDTDDTTRIVVRGGARAVFETAEGPVEIDTAGAGTWVERTLTGVTSTVLDVSDPAAADERSTSEPMTLVSGLVRVSRVQSPAAAAAPAAPAPADDPADVPVDLPATPAVVAGPDAADPAESGIAAGGPDPLGDAPLAPRVPEAGAPVDDAPFGGRAHDEPEPVEPGEPTEMMSLEDLSNDEEPPSVEPAPDEAPWGAAGHGDQPPGPAAPQAPSAPDFGSGNAPERPQWAPAPAPVNPFGPGGPGAAGPGIGEPPPAPGWGPPRDAEPPVAEDGPVPQGAEAAADHDGDTRAGDYDPAVYARSQPGIPGQPPAPSVTAHPVARLLLSSGESIDVDRAILIGRAPEARRFTATEQPRLVTVPSPNQEISSTHLEVRPGSGADHGSAVVTDMGSTNGTVLVQPGLPPEDLQPGIAVQLLPGAVIDMGDGLTIQAANP